MEPMASIEEYGLVLLPTKSVASEIDLAALVETYDVRLSQSLADIDAEHPPPPLWRMPMCL